MSRHVASQERNVGLGPKIRVPSPTDRIFQEGMTSLGAPSQEVYDYTSVRGTFMALGSVLLRG